MGFLSNIASYFVDEKPPGRRYIPPHTFIQNEALERFILDDDKERRGYAAAKQDRLTADWISDTQSANDEIYSAIRTVRARARDLYNNNDIAKKYIRLCQSNIVGPYGIKLQVKSKGTLNDPNALDNLANTQIEEAFRDWSKKENCTVTGRLSLRAVEDLVIAHVARDGDVFIRKVKGKNVNKYGFALQVIEPDHVDDRLNRDNLSNGHFIRMGVEINKWGKPVAYYVRKTKYKSDYSTNMNNYERIPAEEIIHLYDPDRADQLRGISWMVQSIIHLKMLDGYEEAALINARVSAAKMGFFTSDIDGTAEYLGDEEDSEGSPITNVSPGTFEQLPPGMKLDAWNPQFPHEQHSAFIKATLQGISSGLGVSYNNLANDLEGVNYSSIRSGLLEEREQWKRLQSWFIESFLNEIFEEWLEMGMTTGTINLPLAKFEKFNAPVWMPRRWAWVDPLKDVQAHREAIALGVRTRHQVINEEGNDYEEVIEELANEKEDLISKNLIENNEGSSDGNETEPDNTNP